VVSGEWFVESGLWRVVCGEWSAVFLGLIADSVLKQGGKQEFVAWDFVKGRGESNTVEVAVFSWVDFEFCMVGLRG
jgi:hypothetical protein